MWQNAEMWHIIHKRFVSWTIMQYPVSTQVVKMDSSSSKH